MSKTKGRNWLARLVMMLHGALLLVSCMDNVPDDPPKKEVNTPSIPITPTRIALYENISTVSQLEPINLGNNTSLVYSIAGGLDASHFTISYTGLLAFLVPPNFEAPNDSGGDHTYDINISVSDGTVTSTSPIRIEIVDATELDENFGAHGVVLHNVATGSGSDIGYSVALTAEGKIVVAGSSTGASGEREMTVWRFLPDGSLDKDLTTGFGPEVQSYLIRQGYVTHNVSSGNGPSVGYSVALTSDDKIVVAGFSGAAASSTGYAMTVWRLTKNGSLDIGFGPGGQGYMTHKIAESNNDTAYSVALTAENKITVAGGSEYNTGTQKMTVWQITKYGSLDNGFGINGQGYMSYNAAGSNDDAGISVKLTTTGKIVVAGHSYNGVNTGYAMTVWRLYPDGSLDDGSFANDPNAGFGPGGLGYMTHNVAIGSGNDYARSIALTAKGNIVVAGSSDGVSGSGSSMTVWQLTDDGKLDNNATTGFGPRGQGYMTHYVAEGNGFNFGESVALTTDGKIVIVGENYSASRTASEMTVWRLKANGSIDNDLVNGFGPGGQGFMTHFNSTDSIYYNVKSVALTPDDRILTTGYSDAGDGTGRSMTILAIR